MSILDIANANINISQLRPDLKLNKQKCLSPLKSFWLKYREVFDRHLRTMSVMKLKSFIEERAILEIVIIIINNDDI